MNRWVLGGALAIVMGLLGALLVMVAGLTTRGLTVRLAGPVALQDPLGVTLQGEIALHEPVEVAVADVAVRSPQPLVVEMTPTELGVRAAIEGLSCPQCEEGLLIPVRWNLFTGEIVWRCTACGRP
jgi:hypothetical protein